MTAYPYVVVIFKRDNFNSDWKRHCSGSLISSNRVLTAGRCLEGLIPSNLRVVAGTTEIGSANYKPFDVRSRITFREWSKSQANSELYYSEDVGIIELKTDDTNIKPGRIDYAEKFQQPGCKVRLIGWGSDQYEVQSWIPKGAFMEIETETVCASKVQQYFSFMETSLASKKLLCVSSNPSSYGADADFGGPLVAEARRTIVGILIQPCPMNEECPIRKGQPNMMLRLNDFGKFIYHNIRDQINVMHGDQCTP